MLLAGDISIFKDTESRLVEDTSYEVGWRGLIEWLSDNFKMTYLIPGNHEFFGDTLENGFLKIAEYNKYSYKFKILYNEVVHLNDEYAIVGSTLWTNIPKCYSIGLNNNDLQNIKNWSLKKHIEQHKCCISFLKRSLENKNKKYIVVTHHSPSTYDTSNFFFSIESSNCTYSIDLDELLHKSTVWIFGHTHWNIVHKYSKTLLMSNCQGKYYENTGKKYRNDMVFNV